MPHIVVVGSLNMDLVVRVPRMPEPGETILGRDFQTVSGGKGANQAVGAARLAAHVTMIGCVGDDSFGETLVGNLATEGIETSPIKVIPGVPSGIAMITVDEGGQNSIVVASGANMLLTPEDIRTAWESLEDVDVVVMPLEVPLDCIQEAAGLAKVSGAKVVLNPAPARPLPDDLLGNLDVLVPNETETALLSGMAVDTLEQAEKAARHLLKMGVGAVILTLGSRGALMIEENFQSQLFESHSVDVVDTTAAGDAFVAALSVGISEGMDLEEASKMANAAGALAVTKMGAQPSMPTREEVLALLNLER